MRTAEQIARLCGVSPQAVREWCRKNGVAKGAKGKFLIDDDVERRILAYYKADDGKALSQDAQEKDHYCDILINVLREELAVKNRQLEEKDKQIAMLTEELSERLRESHILIGRDQERQRLEEKPPAEEPKEERRKLTKEEENREYMRLCQLMPKNPGFWSDPKTIAEWEDAQDEALSQMEEWEKELLIKRGFKKGFRYLWSKN